ncbi:MAG: hemolysin III family protein [Phycisphaerales bacterium]
MQPPITAFGLTDPAGSLTHLLGAMVFLALGIGLVRRSLWSRPRWISLSVFVSSAVLLLLASGLFHAMPADTPVREVFKRIDHAAIFILIAGTFTPIHVILFKGPLRWGVLIPIWLAAFVGISLKMVFFDSTPEWLGITIYLVMGWAGAIAMVAAWRKFNLRFVSPLVLGGIAYTVGALCEFTGEPTLIKGVIRSHEMFHLAVLVGLGSMWGFIARVAKLSAEQIVGSTIEAKPQTLHENEFSKKTAGTGNMREPIDVA